MRGYRRRNFLRAASLLHSRASSCHSACRWILRARAQRARSSFIIPRTRARGRQGAGAFRLDLLGDRASRRRRSSQRVRAGRARAFWKWLPRSRVGNAHPSQGAGMLVLSLQPPRHFAEWSRQYRRGWCGEGNTVWSPGRGIPYQPERCRKQVHGSFSTVSRGDDAGDHNHAVASYRATSTTSHCSADQAPVAVHFGASASPR